MKSRIATVVLLAGVLWGCAGTVPETRLVEAAREERDAASTRLLSAIAAYCRAKTAALETRLDCIKRTQFEALSSLRARDLPREDFRESIKCERTPRRTNCERDRLSLAKGMEEGATSPAHRVAENASRAGPMGSSPRAAAEGP